MLCRLCLHSSADTINIFDGIGVELSVSTVLGKYFWFEPKQDDPISTVVCNACWITVANFNELYTRVEEAHRLLTERFSMKNESVPSPHGTDCDFKHESAEQPASDSEDTKFLHDENAVMLPELSLSVVDGGQVAAAVMDAKGGVSTNEAYDEALILDVTNGQCNDEKDFLGDITEGVPHGLRRSTRTMEKSFGTPCATPAIKGRRKRRSTTQAEEQTENATGGQTTAGRGGKGKRGRPKNVPKPTEQKPALPNDADNESTASATTTTTTTTVTTAAAETTKNCDTKMQQVDYKIAEFLRLVCDICREEQENFANLRRHMLQEHQMKGYAVCCNRKFNKRVHLADHVHRHLNPDCFKCEECNKVFADKQCMRNHMLLKHQPEEKKTFQCKSCPKRFAKPYLLEQHRITHDARVHICHLCQRGFASPTLLGAHIKIVHGKYGIMCDICAKVIRGRSAFARHQLEHSGVVLPKVQCTLCLSWHKDKYSLQKHQRRHNVDGAEHKCLTCGKVAPNRSALLSHHRNVHAAERRYECGVCKKAFKKPINLKEHMTQHTGEVLYKCPHCTKTFNSNANMHSHRKKIHPKEFEETRRRRLEQGIDPHLAAQPAAHTDGAADLLSTAKTSDAETHNALMAAHEQATAQAGCG